MDGKSPMDTATFETI